MKHRPRPGGPTTHDRGPPLGHEKATEEVRESLGAANWSPLAQQSEEKNAVEWAEDCGDDDLTHVLERAVRRNREKHV